MKWPVNQPTHLAQQNMRYRQNNQFKSDQSLDDSQHHHLVQTVLFIEQHNSGCDNRQKMKHSNSRWNKNALLISKLMLNGKNRWDSRPSWLNVRNFRKALLQWQPWPNIDGRPRAAPDVHAELRQHDPAYRPSSATTVPVKKPTPSSGRPMPKSFVRSSAPPIIGSTPTPPPPPTSTLPTPTATTPAHPLSEQPAVLRNFYQTLSNHPQREPLQSIHRLTLRKMDHSPITSQTSQAQVFPERCTTYGTTSWTEPAQQFPSVAQRRTSPCAAAGQPSQEAQAAYDAALQQAWESGIELEEHSTQKPKLIGDILQRHWLGLSSPCSAQAQVVGNPDDRLTAENLSEIRKESPQWTEEDFHDIMQKHAAYMDVVDRERIRTSASIWRRPRPTFSLQLVHNGSTRSTSRSCCAFGSKIWRM